MKNRVTGLLILFFGIGLTVNAQTPISSARGRECWVFRSVLDNRARILTVALHPDLWVAYDAANGNIFKTWKDGVKLQGAVFTHKHGPQPISLGNAYATEPNNADPRWQWVVSNNGSPVDYGAKFKGYVLKNNKLILKTVLEVKGQDNIVIEESPEFTNLAGNAQNPGLIRSFSVSGMGPGIQLGLKVNVNTLVNKDALSTTGKFVVSNRMENIYSWGSTYGLVGLVTLNPNGNTNLITYFNAKAIQ